MATQQQILVTGGAGYLGSVLCRRLLTMGYGVTVVDSFIYGKSSLCSLYGHPNFEFVIADVRDKSVISRLLTKSDVIIPLAAVVGAPACELNCELAISVNLDSICLLNRLRSQSQLIIFPSTESCYGAIDGLEICTEDTSIAPISLYAKTKADAERVLLDSGNAICFRLATLFGTSPRMRLDLLVNHFCWLALRDGHITVFEKHFKRNFVHVTDAADAFVHGIEHRTTMINNIFNVGLNDGIIAKFELVELIKRHRPDLCVNFASTGRDLDGRNYIISSVKLREFGFSASRSVESGVSELFQELQLLL